MNKKTAFYSACSKNYLPQAEALYNSLKKHNPNAKYHLLLTDNDSISHKNSSFEVISVNNLEDKSYLELQDKYNSFELCNAVRPMMAEYLLYKCEYEKVIYLDTDILVTGSFDKLCKNTNEKTFYINPHILKPFPLDGEKPDDLTLMTYGVYNSGFFLLNKTKKTREILDFLISRNLLYCYNNAPLMFVGQNILSLARSLFYNDTSEINDPEFNIAYWNLHEKNLDFNEYYLNSNERVVFFHFSGFDNSNNNLITKWPHRKNVKGYDIMLKALNEYKKILCSQSTT